MRETLFIFLPSDFTEQTADSLSCQTLVQDSNGNFAKAKRLALNAIAESAVVDTRRARLVVVLPSGTASLISAQVPKQMLRGSASRWQRAIPFSLEDQLADEVDKLHFAMPPKSAIDTNFSESKASVPVATIRHRDLETLQTLLTESGLSAEHWTLDTLLVPLPASGKGIGVIVCNGLAMVRTGPMAGFTCPASMLPMFAQRLAREATSLGPRSDVDAEDDSDNETKQVVHQKAGSLNIQCHTLGLSHEQTDALRESLIKDEHTVVIHTGRADQLEALLAKQFNLRDVNLRQGEYAEQRALNQYLRPWKWVAGVAVLMLCVEVTSGTWQISRNNAVAENARQQTAVAFREALPDVRRIQNPRVQMKQAIEAARGANQGADFLSILAAVSPEISAIEAIEITTIGFRNETLELRLAANTVTTVDKLKDRLETLKNLSYKVISVNAGSDKVDFRINISALPEVAGL
ncbi:MAG: general secretion pathway protein L [Pseudoalteromonas tetraodonis]